MFAGLLSMMMIFGFSTSQAQENKPGAEMKERHETDGGAFKLARVKFIYPTNGATVPAEFMAKFSVEGLKVVPAGDLVPGTGHFHVLIDAPLVAEGVVIAKDDKHLHFGKGEMEAKITLTPGKHKLILQFADGAHRGYNKMLSEEINVTVKK